MVLINELTIDEINAALVHLQRSRTEIVGGTKGDTVNNILINNTGSGNSVDYSNIIDIIQNRLNAHDKTIENDEKRLEENESLDSTQQEQIESLFAQLEELSNNGIQSLQFDATNRYLIIYTQDGNTYDVEIPSETVTMSFDSTTNKLIFVMGNQTQEVVLPFINTSQMGVAGGVATLDENGRVPYSQLPESAMEFKGEWDASTNTPTLTDGTGTNGDFYICSAGGTVNFGTVAEPRLVTFVVNDRVIYEGDTDQWVKLPAGQVASVNGQSGVVELDADDIPYDATMSVKDKLDSASQADWTETDSTDPSFIKHKIPIWITPGSATDDNAQALFDLVHPIGEIYVQYPATDDPNNLYNITGVITSTWTKQSYSGAFFRADGGNAGAFQTTLGTAQSDATAKKGLSISSTLSIGNASSGGTANVTASGGVDHSHNMAHYHNKGTMKITGSIKGTGYSIGSNTGAANTGALQGSEFNMKTCSGTSQSASYMSKITLDTSLSNGSGWSGLTSSTVNSGGTAITNTGSASAYSHSHNVYLRGSVSLGNGDTETRPTNYTIQIWKRTA